MKKTLISILTCLIVAISISHTAVAQDEEIILYCPDEYIRICEIMEKKYDVSASLLIAIIQTESSCKPDVVSSEGCIGLMQIHPCNNPDNLDLTDPRTNIELGTKALLDWKDKATDGDLLLTLSLYNGSGNKAYRWYEKGQFSKMKYANKVSKLAQQIDEIRYPIERRHIEESKKTYTEHERSNY